MAAGMQLVEHDRVRCLATFRFQPDEEDLPPIIYVASVPWDPAQSVIEVTCRIQGQPRPHRDRFDVAIAAQRNRFAQSAIIGTAHGPETVADGLLTVLDRLRDLVAPANPIQSRFAPADESAALAVLTDSDLLEKIGISLPWPGDPVAKQAAYLAMTSRLAAKPLAVSFGPSPIQAPASIIADLCPPEERLQFSIMSARSLCHDDLKHKLLVLDDTKLKPEAYTALRVLRERGALSSANRIQDPATGRWRSCWDDIEGPVAVLAATDCDLCLPLRLDTSPEQAERVIAAQRQRAAQGAGLYDAKRQQALHHDLQRLLQPLPVRIPYASRIVYDEPRLDLQEALLGLITASALLHQHQREQDHGTILASEVDFQIATRLLPAISRHSHAGLSAKAATLWGVLPAGDDAFKLADAARLLPTWSRYAIRQALAELCTLDYVAHIPGRGRGGARYQRQETCEMCENTVAHLSPVRERA